MKLILGLTLALTVLFFLFGSVKSGGREVTQVIPRFIISLIGGFVLSLFIGLPILGIYYLIVG